MKPFKQFYHDAIRGDVPFRDRKQDDHRQAIKARAADIKLLVDLPTRKEDLHIRQAIAADINDNEAGTQHESSGPTKVNW